MGAIALLSPGPLSPGPLSPGPLPALAVTGVGSLPIEAPDAAVAFVAAHAPVVPFWPQLPLRHAGEGMLRQTLGDPGTLLEHGPRGGAGMRVARGRAGALITWLDDAPAAIGPAEAAGFTAFLSALRHGGLPAARAVKGQLTGPVTLAAMLEVDGRPAAETPAVAAALVRRVRARATWQARALLDHGLPTLVVIDEPVLGVERHAEMVDVVGALQPVVQAIRDTGALAGLHTCAGGAIPLPSRPPPPAPPPEVPPPWQPDLWSLDLHGRDGLLPAVVRNGWATGGHLAAGLVPTTGAAAFPTAAALAATWLAAADAREHDSAGDLGDLADRTLVTATCGLAGLDLRDAEASFVHAADVARQIRRLVGSPLT